VIETTYKLPFRPDWISEVTPKFVPNNKDSLSVISNLPFTICWRIVWNGRVDRHRRIFGMGRNYLHYRGFDILRNLPGEKEQSVSL
jgi:hypothetical protein